MPALRVQVAGRGAVTCFGVGHQTLVEAVFSGDVGVRPLERLSGTPCNTGVAAEVTAEILARAPDRISLPLHLATLAAREACSDWSGSPDHRTLLCVSSTKGDMSGITAPGTGLGNPHKFARALAAELSHQGPIAALSCACASGLAALAYAARLIQSGSIDAALVVGADTLSPFVAQGFGALLALSPEPARPFDRHRMGLSLGEGAGAIVLSRHRHESIGYSLAGWGQSNDANHITGPCRDGSGLVLAIQRALACAKIEPELVDLVHLHGTGTQYNDAMEARAMAQVFEEQPAAASTKGQIGHTLGAACEQAPSSARGSRGGG